MPQLPLPGMGQIVKPINIAKVPHRSPFRYPGGKTWFVPYMRRWLATSAETRHLIEPFAGGGIIGLTAAFENLVDHVTLVEIDNDVAAVWKAIIVEGEGKELAQQIVEFDLTQDHINALLESIPKTIVAHALQTIVRNRINRGGILASGAGRIKAGENGKGLHSRWYPKTLSNRIHAIHEIRHKLTFIHGDGLGVIKHNQSDTKTWFFVDPPYSVAGKQAGKRLYTHSKLDHDRLFDYMSKVKGDFIMTYDNNMLVQQMAGEYSLPYHPIPMKNTHHAELTELVISHNLDWLN